MYVLVTTVIFIARFEAIPTNHVDVFSTLSKCEEALDTIANSTLHKNKEFKFDINKRRVLIAKEKDYMIYHRCKKETS